MLYLCLAQSLVFGKVWVGLSCLFVCTLRKGESPVVLQVGLAAGRNSGILKGQFFKISLFFNLLMIFLLGLVKAFDVACNSLTSLPLDHPLHSSFVT